MTISGVGHIEDLVDDNVSPIWQCIYSGQNIEWAPAMEAYIRFEYQTCASFNVYKFGNSTA